MRVLSVGDRPREKLERLGVCALGDNELLAIVVAQGHRRATALEVANVTLARLGGVVGLTRTTIDQLCTLHGVGRAKAVRILAAVELGRRTLRGGLRPRAQLLTPREAAAYLLPTYGARSVEQFGVVLLDAKHRVERVQVLSVGTLDASLVHPREVFRAAVTAGAAGLLLFHNHPSGDPTPSRDDVALTRRLVSAGELMGIEILDHVILADARYFSFKEAGALGR